MNDREVIREWIAEQFAAVEETGAVSGIALMHYAGGGTQEVELHTMRAGTPHWANADGMADVCDRIARRHASGLAGTQTFQLVAVFGGQTKASRFLPFSRAGMLSITGGGGTGVGGLMSEPPTPTGVMSTAQRWGEEVLRHVQAKDVALTNSVAQLVRDLGTANKDLLHQNMEFALGIQKLVADQQAAKAEMAVRVVNAKRNAELANQALRLAPAAINGALGQEIFPQAAASVAVLRGLSKTLNREQVAHLASLAGGDLGNQAALAALMDQLTTIREQDEAEAAKVSELTKDLQGDGSYESGELEAGGEPAVAHLPDGVPEPQLTERANGHAANGSNAADGGDDTQLVNDFVESIPRGQLGMMLGVLGRTNRGLAERLRARAKKVGRDD
jgi:hypothetical protein